MVRECMLDKPGLPMRHINDASVVQFMSHQSTQDTQSTAAAAAADQFVRPLDFVGVRPLVGTFGAVGDHRPFGGHSGGVGDRPLVGGNIRNTNHPDLHHTHRPNLDATGQQAPPPPPSQQQQQQTRQLQSHHPTTNNTNIQHQQPQQPLLQQQHQQQPPQVQQQKAPQQSPPVTTVQDRKREAPRFIEKAPHRIERDSLPSHLSVNSEGKRVIGRPPHRLHEVGDRAPVLPQVQVPIPAPVQVPIPTLKGKVVDRNPFGPEGRGPDQDRYNNHQAPSSSSAGRWVPPSRPQPQPQPQPRPLGSGSSSSSSSPSFGNVGPQSKFAPPSFSASASASTSSTSGGGGAGSASQQPVVPPANRPYQPPSLVGRYNPPSGRHGQGPHYPHGKDSIEEPNQAIFRKVRGILNKLTPEKFKKLCESLVSLGLNSPSLLKGVILLIFDKALEEPKYSSMYAQLCLKLSEDLPNFENNGNSNDSIPNTFCRLLLIKCRDEFENRRQAAEVFNDRVRDGNGNGYYKLTEEEKEQKGIAKSKMLGNIKFICELGRQGLVQENILHMCIKQLVSKKITESIQNKSEDFECLCQIVKTVGSLLDTDKARKLMDQYFERIEFYSKCTELPSRIRFMLKDCMDLRDNKWVPRRIQVENGPKTIQQIHEEAAKDMGISTMYLDPNSPSTAAFLQGFNNGIFSTYNQFNDFLVKGGQSSNFFPFTNGSKNDVGIYMNPTLGSGPGSIHDTSFSGLGPAQSPLNHARKVNSSSPVGGGSSPNQEFVPYRTGTDRVPSQGGPQGGGVSVGEREKMGHRTINPNNNNMGPGLAGNNQQGMNKGGAPYVIPPRLSMNNRQGSHGQIPLPTNTNMNSLSSLSQLKVGSGDISLRPSANSMIQGIGKTGSQEGVVAPGGAGGLVRDVAGLKMDAKPVIAETKAVVTIPPKPSAREVLVKKIEEIMEQVNIEAENVDDLVAKVKALKVQKNHQSDVLGQVIKSTLGKSDKDRELGSDLITKLKGEGIITSISFVTGMKCLLQNSEVLEQIDSLVKTHLAEFIARAVIAETIDMKESCDLVEEHYPMFLLVLQQLRNVQGETGLSSALENSKINLMQVLPEGDRTKEKLADILEKRGLSFLYPLLRIESEIVKVFDDSLNPPTLTSLSGWVKENVDPSLVATKGFIQIFFTALCKHIIEEVKGNEAVYKESDPVKLNKTISDIEKEMIQEYAPMLTQFLNKPSLQLTALYSLQSVCHDQGFPKGLILRWFNNLYDLEIIYEEIFLRWKEDINDDYKGKGQALFQVNTWLVWLAETEGDSEEEDDNDEE